MERIHVIFEDSQCRKPIEQFQQCKYGITKPRLRKRPKVMHTSHPHRDLNAGRPVAQMLLAPQYPVLRGLSLQGRLFPGPGPSK